MVSDVDGGTVCIMFARLNPPCNTLHFEVHLVFYPRFSTEHNSRYNIMFAWSQRLHYMESRPVYRTTAKPIRGIFKYMGWSGAEATLCHWNPRAELSHSVPLPLWVLRIQLELAVLLERVHHCITKRNLISSIDYTQTVPLPYTAHFYFHSSISLERTNLEVATSAVIVMKLVAPTMSTLFLPNLTLDWLTTAVRSTRGARRTFRSANLKESTTPC